MVQERKVTDAGFGICFIVFAVVFVALAGYSFSIGSIVKLIGVNDANGGLCGSE